MSEKKKGTASWLSIETIIIGAFFLFFIIWAAQKCNNTARIKQAESDAVAARDSMNRNRGRVAVTPPAPISVTPPAQTTVQSITPPRQPVVAAPTTPTPAPKPTTPIAPTPAKASEAMLYVVIDGLNVRAEPNLKGKSYGKLKLHDQVYFLGKVTEDTQKLSLGTEEANEPWVKIRTKRNTVGWVYGAGVSYYKTKRKGVL